MCWVTLWLSVVHFVKYGADLHKRILIKSEIYSKKTFTANLSVTFLVLLSLFLFQLAWYMFRWLAAQTEWLTFGCRTWLIPKLYSPSTWWTSINYCLIAPVASHPIGKNQPFSYECSFIRELHLAKPLGGHHRFSIYAMASKLFCYAILVFCCGSAWDNLKEGLAGNWSWMLAYNLNTPFSTVGCCYIIWCTRTILCNSYIALMQVMYSSTFGDETK